jgi:hypothetical protein
MKSYAYAFGASVVVAACASAQDAVEWRVADGGNGHWYQLTHSPGTSWSAAAASALSQGGQLATLTSEHENAFVVARLQGHPSRYPWIGLKQSATGREPASGWGWISGEPLDWSNWSPSEPNGDGVDYADEGNLWLVTEPGRPLGTWNDWTTGGPDGYLVEWSADCNGDGVVDFGQIRAGQLADANSDNIPDVCQCPTPHVVRVPQDAPSIAAAVALACLNNSMEIVLSPGTWTMAIDTDDPALSFTIRGLDKATCIVTSASAGTLLNARYGSTVRLTNLTVADLVPGSEPAQDLAWDLYFDGCLVRNCTGSFLFDGGPSPFPAALSTRFESCIGSGFGILYFNGSETINLCDFVGCTRGVSVWGTSTITNCTFTATSGYAVQARASFQMSGCDFTNTAGPAISCAQTAPITATMTVCHFTAGTDSAIVDTNYVPVDTQPGGVWDISSCGFYGNSASLDGGAIRVGINRAVTLTNSEFINNATSGWGGAFSQAFGGYAQSLAASGCQFIGNRALSGQGGALNLRGWSGAAQIANTAFFDNQAVAGGAICAERTQIDIASCNFDENDATQTSVESGGAILISFGAGPAGSRIRNSNFRNNTAAGRGGAIAYYFYVSTDIEDCLFTGNTAAVGGALSVFDNCNPAIRRCSFSGNTAPFGGEAVVVFGAPGPSGVLTRLDSCRFSNQPAGSTGSRALEAWTAIEMGATSFCASGLEPYTGAITEISPNCVALSCADNNANGVVDECEGTLSAIRVPLDYPNIQAAIDAVPAGVHRDIFVLAGTYNESFTLDGKDVVVRGAAGGTTIIDGTGLTTSIARFTGGEPATAGVQDLVFRNGAIGSLIYPGAPFRVGGAIFGSQSQAFVRNCSFQQNRSDFGGAIYLLRCDMLVEGCSFSGNVADSEGGAAMGYESSGAIRNCTFTANRCGEVNPGSGSGFKSVGARTAGGTVLLDGCTFTGGVAGVDGAAVEHFENTAGVRGALRVVGTQITGNSSNLGASGLRSTGTRQSCVLADGTSVCGNANRNVDGPYLIEGNATVCDCLADLVIDGSVNGGDLGVVLNAWGLANSQGAGDVNHDGVVNGVDLGLLLSAWGACP